MGGDKHSLTQTLKGLWAVTALAILCAATFCICINTAYADEASINADNEISFESEDETFAPALQTMAIEGTDDFTVGIKVQVYDKQVYERTSEKAVPQGSGSFSYTRIRIESAQDDVVVSGGHYSRGKVIEYLTTDSRGNAQSNRKYSKGTYLAVIEQIPWDYRVNGSVSNKPQTAFTITDDDKGKDYVDIDPDGKFGFDIARGGVIVAVHDIESLLAKPQGGASLSYVSFNIVNRNSNTIYYYDYGDRSAAAGKTLSLNLNTDSTGAAHIAADTLPVGRYAITFDDGNSSGYENFDFEPIEFEITSSGQMPLVSVYGSVGRGGFAIQSMITMITTTPRRITRSDSSKSMRMARSSPRVVSVRIWKRIAILFGKTG